MVIILIMESPISGFQTKSSTIDTPRHIAYVTAKQDRPGLRRIWLLEERNTLFMLSNLLMDRL